MAMTPDPETLAFMEALFGYVPTGKHTLLWTLQDKRSTWIPLGEEDSIVKLAEAAQYFAAEARDVYIAVSTANTDGKNNERIMSVNATGIVGLWADIDIADPDVHKKWNLPPDEKGARELLTSTDLEPSVIIHSGHGLQAWWLFDEFWAFETESDRIRAADLAQRWNSTLRACAARRGWTVDSTFDLARVMRVPGTFNRKGMPVVPVRLIENNTRRFCEDDFAEKFIDERELRAAGITASKDYVPDPIEIHDASAPNLERFQALMTNDERFAATFNMKRKDLTDQSPSSYDMSIANQLAMTSGWTDQDIADCIFFFRRHNKLDLTKARRTDYLLRTITMARNAAARGRADEEIEEAIEALVVAEANQDPEAIRDAKRAGRDALGTTLGLEILNWIKYMSEPGSYALETPIGRVDIGEIENLMRYDRFRSKVLDAVGHLIQKRFKGADWDKVVDGLNKIRDEQDVGLEATSHGEMLSWLTQYLAARPPASDLREASINEYPYVDSDGRVVIFGPGFKRWLYQAYQERISPQVMGKRLRAFGCDIHTVNVETDNGKRTSRSVWKLPADGLK